jgi:hypothetical protein
VSDFETDGWGTWISVRSPVGEDGGRMLAALGIDYRRRRGARASSGA